MARRVVAVLVLLACVFAVGCGGQEPNAHRGATVKTPRPAPVAEGSGGFVAIGDGRRLYMECVGSGSPTVVLEAGFGADTLSWRDVPPEVGRGTRTCRPGRCSTPREAVRVVKRCNNEVDSDELSAQRGGDGAAFPIAIRP